MLHLNKSKPPSEWSEEIEGSDEEWMVEESVHDIEDDKYREGNQDKEKVNRSGSAEGKEALQGNSMENNVEKVQQLVGKRAEEAESDKGGEEAAGVEGNINASSSKNCGLKSWQGVGMGQTYGLGTEGDRGLDDVGDGLVGIMEDGLRDIRIKKKGILTEDHLHQADRQLNKRKQSPIAEGNHQSVNRQMEKPDVEKCYANLKLEAGKVCMMLPMRRSVDMPSIRLKGKGKEK
ncbi:hypothetical protein L6452_35444 [Arctium lappa]|uniref:Uncharacterized protein n=1 Tax=Arctium lappa TaxID=4217 RepID=A0ACB8Y795_ARCLA|nr:hypothetical protein L6452_35444 [Arctium lappa]